MNFNPVFFRVLVLGCACIFLTACLPGFNKSLFRPFSSASQSADTSYGQQGLFPQEDIIDEELRQASADPQALVAEPQEVLELSENSLDSLEWRGVPAGLMLLEMPVEEEWHMPAVPSRPASLDSEKKKKDSPAASASKKNSSGSEKNVKAKKSSYAYNSRETQKIARKNTKESLCRNGETLCITSPFGVKRKANRWHKGIDIRAPLGSPIKAFRSGEVIRAQYHRTFGYLVEVRQDDGLVARYAHLSQILTHKGAKIYPGLMIGRVGSTGRSTGPHLHFELLHDTRHVNPMALISSPKELIVKGTEQDAAAARAALTKAGKNKKKTKKSKKSSSKKSKTAAKKASK